MRPWLLRHLMNIWGPFRGAGIVVTALAEDWSHARVVLKQGLLNRNYVGTHFGGSLFAMTDAFYMLMLINRLGKGYRVWDSAASIEYLTPGRGTVSAEFQLDDPTVEWIRRTAAAGEAVFPEFDVEVRDTSGAVVARVHKTIYVRRRICLTARLPSGAAVSSQPGECTSELEQRDSRSGTRRLCDHLQSFHDVHAGSQRHRQDNRSHRP